MSSAPSFPSADAGYVLEATVSAGIPVHRNVFCLGVRLGFSKTRGESAERLRVAEALIDQCGAEPDYASSRRNSVVPT